MTWFLIAIGAAIGAPARYLLDYAITRRGGSHFPVGTLAINVVGSAVLGALAARTTTGYIYTAVGTGFCGAFTTFSTFTWETLSLAEDAAPWLAVANVALSLLLGLGAASATYSLSMR